MNNDRVFYAATKILAASVTGAKGNGLHKSPELVAEAVDLAEQLVDEIESRNETAAPPPRPATPAIPPAK